MLNKIKFVLMSGTLLSLVFTAVLVFAPANVSAQDVPFYGTGEGSGPTYAAGNLRTGTSICRCPVLTGNCVCEIGPQ